MRRPRVASGRRAVARGMTYCGVPDRWLPAPELPVLAPRDVHVWRASLDPGDAVLARFEALLTREELARAARFRVAHGRRRFIAARGMLRDVLARYTGTDAAALRLELGGRGKPFLPAGPHFNLSHAAESALVAVTAVAPVGVDVEAVRTLPDFAEVAERYFARGEIDALRRATPEDYPEAWYRCWTRKEAYIKATGDGLHCPLDAFEVTLLPGDPPAIRSLGGSARAARGWSVHHLATGDGTVGALAIEARDVSLQLWNWRPREGA